jgi:hypothetical protein
MMRSRVREFFEAKAPALEPDNSIDVNPMTIGYASISDGKALARVSGVFDLIGERDCIILERDAAAVVVGQQLIAAETKFPCALAGHEHRGGRQKRPIERSFVTQQIGEDPPAAASALYIDGNRGVSISFTPGATSRLPVPPTTR